MKLTLPLALFLVLLPPTVQAQNANPVAGLAGPLDGLMLPHEGTAKHEGSWDRAGGNADMRPVPPGGTITLLDTRGAGVIHRFWMAFGPRSEPSIQRGAILRMYWDGETSPSVEAPIGDFFGVGFGEQRDYISLPLSETSGGYNCYWPMPFHRSARWTLTNLSGRPIDGFWWNIDYTAFPSLSPSLRHFHAQWRRENPTTRNRNYTILEATGQGHYVGAALFMQRTRGRGLSFLEGDEMIWIDGEKTPSINGTGTEDYFSSGWYFDRGTYSAPFHGVVIKDEATTRISAYRWHIEDAMPFRRSIRVTIEHGTNNEVEGDYSSVAYWYQTEPHAPFGPLPPLVPGLPAPPLKIAGAIEAESLAAQVSTGDVGPQDLAGFPGTWSEDAQLFWQPKAMGATLQTTLRVGTAGTYDLVGYFTKASDYGTLHFSLGGQAMATEFNGFNPDVMASGPITLGRVTLPAGDSALTITVAGKDARSSGYYSGIDAFVLKPVG